MSVTMDVEKARTNMIKQQIRPWEVLDPGVLDLLWKIKREDFVPEKYKSVAFADIELPLKDAKEPSQVMLAPKIEAKVLQALALKDTDRVLEIGAGSGYMAALLAAQAEFVYSVDIDPQLVEMARVNLKRVGITNVSVDLGDGANGWSMYAPYDAIVISASTPELPQQFYNDLKVGGRMVVIVGREPVMQAQLIVRMTETSFSSVMLFETVAAPLVNAFQGKTFSF